MKKMHQNIKKNILKSKCYIGLKITKSIQEYKNLLKCSNLLQIYVKITMLYRSKNTKNAQKSKQIAKLS